VAEFILYTGPMFSSKTTKLLMEADTRQYRKQKIISFKSRLDNRYSQVGEIVTHNFNKLPAFLVHTGDELINVLSKNEEADVVLIDELFMINGVSDVCIELFKKGYTIIASSIDLSFQGEPFKEVQKIMPYCTKIVKCTAVCPVCGDDARYTFKKETEENKDVIQIGGDELYEPRCQLHYNYMQL
jgi:thymidine kinase